MSKLTKEDVRRDIIPVLVQIPTLGIIDNLDVHKYFSMYSQGELLGTVEIEDNGTLSVLTADDYDINKRYYTSTDSALVDALRLTGSLEEDSDIWRIALFEMCWRLKEHIGIFKRYAIGATNKAHKVTIHYIPIVKSHKDVQLSLFIKDNKLYAWAHTTTIGACSIEDPNVFDKLIVLIDNYMLRESQKIKDFVINQYNLVKDINCEIST